LFTHSLVAFVNPSFQSSEMMQLNYPDWKIMKRHEKILDQAISIDSNDENGNTDWLIHFNCSLHGNEVGDLHSHPKELR
jgi:hypothetical protein